jgi:hypothetical protein
VRGGLDGWSEDINLTSNENRSISPDIAVWENKVHVVYAEDEGGPGYIDERFVWYISSNDNGETWNSSVRLDEEPSKALKPKIAVWDDKIHVIWFEFGDHSLHYVRSFDNGKTWSTERTIASGCYESGWHDITVNNSYVHVSYPSSDFKVSYVSSTDDGTTWITPKNLIPSNSSTARMAIAVSGANVHIVWKDTKRAGISPQGYPVYDIFYIKSEDNGFTWFSDEDITQTPLNRSSLPDIEVSGQNIYVIYTQDDGIYQLYLSYSRDNGNTWVKNVKLTNSPKHVSDPSIAVENGNIYILWEDSRDRLYEIYFKSSSNYGQTWDNSTRITDLSGCIYPEITADKYWVHVVWWKMWWTGYGDDVYYKRREVSRGPIETTIDIDPDTLNLKSKGRWITCYIDLPEGYNVNEIDISTILLEDTIPAEWGDVQGSTLMVKFSRSEVEDYIGAPQDAIELWVTGEFYDGTQFEGSDTIRVICPP